MDPMLVAIGVATACALALAVMYLYGRVANPRAALRARIEPHRDLTFDPKGVLRKRRGGLPLVHRLPVSAEGRERAQLQLERGGLTWRVQEFLALRVGLALVFAVSVAVLSASGGLAPAAVLMFALVAMIVGWGIPGWYLGRRQKQRLIKIESQLPDALTAISKSLRAGSGLMQSLAYAADETPAPLGPELGSALRDLQLGAEAVDVFEALSQRVGSSDLDIAVTAIIIQRTVGGNLSEILSNVTSTIRERAKIQREVRVLVTRQMLQANLTAALPVAIAALFIFVSPDIGGTLLTTTAGNIALAFAVCCEALGIFVVRRLAVIEV